MNTRKTKAKLILEDGSEFSGYSFGYEDNTNGEVVFNTGMVGYPETMTDPSYRGQILVCTYPLIGNYGIPSKEKENGLFKNFESENIHCRALIVTDYSFEYSHWSAERSLSDWMIEEKIPGIYGIDTRMLTRKLRDKGTMLGKIIIDEKSKIDFQDPNKTNLVDEVSVKKVIEYKAGKQNIVLVDCGTKNNIIRAFLGRDITVIRVPYDYDFTNIEANGIVISNGPGDPKLNTKTIEHAKIAMQSNKPILGICLGTQIILSHSEENNTSCLGILPGTVRAFAPHNRSKDGQKLKIPHMGWNGIRIDRSHPLLSGVGADDEFYFVHSFYPEPEDNASVIAVTDYGISFASIVGFNNLFATQFHLEKSGRPGLKILENFCRWTPS